MATIQLEPLAEEILDGFLSGAAHEADEADPYRTTFEFDDGPQTLSVRGTFVEDMEVWYELQMYPDHVQTERVRISCHLTTDVPSLPPLVAILKIGDDEWAMDVDASGDAHWHLSRAQLRDPKKPSRVKRPIMLTLCLRDALAVCK